MYCNCMGGPNCCMFRAQQRPKGEWVWPKPEPCGPLSDPNRSHIYRSPRWVPEPKKLYR